MITVEQYKLFHNSKDFENIYKKSIPDLIKFFPDERKFYNEHVKKAIAQKKMNLFFKDGFIIGYMFYEVKNRKAFWSFDFLLKKYRKYSRIFRTYMGNVIAKEADELIFWIHKKNASPLNSVNRILKFLGKPVEAVVKYDGMVSLGEYYKINLRSFDKLQKDDTLKEYETRSSLHFGTFAPEIARIKISNDDSHTISKEKT